MVQPRRTHEDYLVGIICALAIEKAPIVAMLDELHPKLEKENGDDNDYTLGRIDVHNVVIACLPAGLMGNGPAAIVANNMRRSFPIKFGLMVGVGGGVWSKKDDIRLGDIVIGQPTGTHGGVVQWDHGKVEQGGKFRRTGSLNMPPPVLLRALQALKTFHETDGIDIQETLSVMIKNKPRMAKKYKYQGPEHDQLFEATYDHKGDDECEGCDTQSIVPRTSREDSTPEIHYGNIASGNQVMKHGATRDRIAKDENVICFEMEAAGLVNDFPCLVIRGICDYADSHKNKRWQPYAAATAAAFARVLLGFIDKQEVIKTPREWIFSNLHIAFPSLQDCVTPKYLVLFYEDAFYNVAYINLANFKLEAPKPLRVLPFGRNKDFVGRHSQLDRLITILYTEDTEEDCQRAALVGLGGVGKTQIALEIAFQIQKLCPQYSLFWVRASDVTSFESAYRQIGQQLKIPGLDDDKADVKELVRARLSLESSGKWIMIVDNADDFELFYNRADESTESYALHEYLPFSSLGAILFTTRDHEAATRYAGSNVIVIEEMDDLESRELLKTSLQNKRLIEDEDGTTKLLKLLVNLPLAIMQAAAYLNAKGVTIAEYLRIYEEGTRDRVIKLLSKDFEDRRRYPGMKNPVATTWLISFEQIRLRDPLAADYMAFISCINDQDIPRDLLPPAPQLEKTEAIGTLKAFGFIKERLRGESYDMHRLVHIAMQSWLNVNDELISWNEKTLKQIADTFPWPEHENRAVWTMYLPHAQCIIASTKFCSGLEKSRGGILHNIGGCFDITGKYAEAEEMYREALVLGEEVLGAKHPSTLNSMNNLALVLDNQGKYAEAEEMHRQTLQLNMKVRGAEHPSTLDSMNNLASILNSQGKYTEAEEMHRQTLQLKVKVRGAEHPSTLNSMNNLALVLDSQGKYAEAEEIHRQTLQLKVKVGGAEHPSTLHSMNNLALVLDSQGKYTEAEEMHRQTLQLNMKVRGAEHPSTLHSMNNLALVLDSQGKYAEAEEMHQQTLQLNMKVGGAEHPSTLDSMNNLALVLDSQGKYIEAEEMHRQTLQLMVKTRGAEHPSTLNSMNNLALVLDNQGKYAEAEEMHRQTLQLMVKVRGAEHPSTLDNINNLASMLNRQGKYAEAEEMHQQTLQLNMKVRGAEHPSTLRSMDNLALVLRNQSRYVKAEEMHRQALQLKVKVLGAEHPSALRSMDNLAEVLRRQGKHEEADNMHLR